MKPTDFSMRWWDEDDRDDDDRMEDFLVVVYEADRDADEADTGLERT